VRRRERRTLSHFSWGFQVVAQAGRRGEQQRRVKSSPIKNVNEIGIMKLQARGKEGGNERFLDQMGAFLEPGLRIVFGEQTYLWGKNSKRGGGKRRPGEGAPAANEKEWASVDRKLICRRARVAIKTEGDHL